MALGFLKKLKHKELDDAKTLDKFQQAMDQLSLSGQAENSKEIQNAKEIIVSKVKSIESQSKEIKGLEEQINDLTVQYRAFHQDIKKYDLIRQKNQQIIAALKAKKGKLPSLEQARSYTDKIKNELKKQNQFFLDQKKKYLAQKKELQVLLAQEKELREKIEQQKFYNRDVLKRINDLELDLALASASAKEHSNKLQYYKVQIAPFSEKEKGLLTQIAELNKSSALSQEAVSGAEQKMRALHNSIAKKAEELKELEEKSFKFSTSIKEKNEVIKKLEADVLKHQKNVEDQKTKVRALENQEKHLDTIIQEQRAKNKELSGHLSGFGQKYESLSRLLSERAAEAKSLGDVLNTETKKWQMQELAISELEEQIAFEDIKVRDLEGRIKKIMDSATHSGKKINTLESTIAAAKKEKERSVELFQKLSARTTEQRSYIGVLEKRLEDISRQKDEIAKKEKSARSVFEKVELTVNELEAQVARDASMALAYSREVKAKEQSLKDKNNAVSGLQTKLNELAKEISELEALDTELEEELSVQDHLLRTKAERISTLEQKKQKMARDLEIKKQKRPGRDLPV